MQLSGLDPCLDRALLDVTQQRSLTRRHLLGLRLTYGASSQLLEDAGNDNLFRLNDDFGVPSTHARLPFKALPNGLIVVESSESA